MDKWWYIHFVEHYTAIKEMCHTTQANVNESCKHNV